MVLYNKTNFRHDKISFAIATAAMACSQEKEVGSWAPYILDGGQTVLPPGGDRWYFDWQQDRRLYSGCVKPVSKYNI